MRWLCKHLIWALLCFGGLQNCVAQNCCIDPQLLTQEAFPISSSDLSQQIATIVGKAYAHSPEPPTSMKLRFDIDKTGCITALEVCEPPHLLRECSAEIHKALLHQCLFSPAKLYLQAIDSQVIYRITCIRWLR